MLPRQAQGWRRGRPSSAGRWQMRHASSSSPSSSASLGRRGAIAVLAMVFPSPLWESSGERKGSHSALLASASISLSWTGQPARGPAPLGHFFFSFHVLFSKKENRLFFIFPFSQKKKILNVDSESIFMVMHFEILHSFSVGLPLHQQ